jgi:hypothetical protein
MTKDNKQQKWYEQFGFLQRLFLVRDLTDSGILKNQTNPQTFTISVLTK